MAGDPTFIGTVQDVSGATVSVELDDQTVTGLSFVNGEVYRIGQVGGFVRIPIGYIDLFGVVSQVGAGAAPGGDDNTHPYGNRWLKVQLVGEGRHRSQFHRGVSQHPSIGDRVHLVTETDLESIFGPGEPQDFVAVGRLASAPSIPALLDINKLVTRHSAVLGATGAGKSTTVAGMLASLSNPARYPSSRILVLDIHGEYSRALTDRASVLRVAPDSREPVQPLHVPFWALTFEEFARVSFGELSDTQAATIGDLVLTLKKESLDHQPRNGVTAETITVDSPVPFNVRQLWFRQHVREHLMVTQKQGGTPEDREPAYAPDAQNKPLLGDAEALVAPVFRSSKTTGPKEQHVVSANEGVGLRRQLAAMQAKLRDPRFAFLFNPGDWMPDPSGSTKKDLDALLAGWLGGPLPITILDLSGVPSVVLNDLVGVVLRVAYDALFWGRNLPEGGRERPLLVVLEEAHAYLGRDNAGGAAAAVRRIAKEGRKYGVGIMIVSQRPSEIDPTILSQCGTLIAMRLSNEIDRSHVAGAASDNLKGLFEMLPVLRTGEAVVVGEAVSLPMRALVDAPPRDRRPDSGDPRVVARTTSGDAPEGPGGWNRERGPEDYRAVVTLWRRQTPRYDQIPIDRALGPSGQVEKKGAPVTRTPVSSTSLASVGYDEASGVLEVEFRTGVIYQYFDVPTQVYASLMSAASQGQYFSQNIKGVYRYARV